MSSYFDTMENYGVYADAYATPMPGLDGFHDVALRGDRDKARALLDELIELIGEEKVVYILENMIKAEKR